MLPRINRIKLDIQIKNGEGLRLALYDDKTGKALRKGDTLIGNPTIGWGTNLFVPITTMSAQFLFDERLNSTIIELYEKLPWINDLSEVRQRALIDMAYNLGVPKLLKFEPTLELIKSGEYVAAARRLETKPWYKQVGRRAVRIVHMIEFDMNKE